MAYTKFPANIRLDEGVLIKANIFALLIRLQKTSSGRLDHKQYIGLGHTSSRRHQDIFKMSSRHLQDVLQRCLQDVLSSETVLGNTISRRLRDVFKTFLRRTDKTVIYGRFA